MEFSKVHPPRRGAREVSLIGVFLGIDPFSGKYHCLQAVDVPYWPTADTACQFPLFSVGKLWIVLQVSELLGQHNTPMSVAWPLDG